MSSARASIAVKLHGAIVHVTLDDISVGFALESICKSMASEIRVVLINSRYFWSFLDCHVHISSITPSFYTGIFALYLSGKWSGAYLLAERERLKVLGRLLRPVLSGEFFGTIYGTIYRTINRTTNRAKTSSKTTYDFRGFCTICGIVT